MKLADPRRCALDPRHCASMRLELATPATNINCDTSCKLEHFLTYWDNNCLSEQLLVSNARTCCREYHRNAANKCS